MSILERGKQEVEQRELDRVRKVERDRATNYQRVVMFFRMGFLRRGDDTSLENWEPAGDSSTSDSEFDYEGVHYRVSWRFEGTGGDRAYWDDGWWPNFCVVVSRPYKWFPFLSHNVEVPVWGAASVAKVLES